MAIYAVECLSNASNSILDVVLLLEDRLVEKKFANPRARIYQTTGTSPPISYDNCFPANNILHVGSGQTYSTLIDAYNASEDGDAIIIHPGTHSATEFRTGGGETITKNIKIFGATGNPNNVTLTASSTNQWFVIRMDLMSESNVSPGFYHLSFNRNQYSWRHYFTIYGKSDPNNATFTLENSRLTGSMGSMHVTTIQQSYPKVIFNNVDYMSSPYEIMHGNNPHQFAEIYVNSLYRTGYSTEYYRSSNFNIVVNNHSANPATHGTSQYNQSEAYFPCGYSYP